MQSVFALARYSRWKHLAKAFLKHQRCDSLAWLKKDENWFLLPVMALVMILIAGNDPGSSILGTGCSIFHKSKLYASIPPSLFPRQLNFKTRTVCHTELRNSARLNLSVKDFWELYTDLMLTLSPCSPLYRHSYLTQALVSDLGPASGGQETENRFHTCLQTASSQGLGESNWWSVFKANSYSNFPSPHKSKNRARSRDMKTTHV